MKTLSLEESIQWMEKCIFEGADWNEDFWSNFTDALHYLKEYRNCGACAYADSYLRCTKEDRNDPLSWQELKAMEGKPVWVETENCGAHWYIIESIDDDMIIVIGKYYERINYYHDDDFIRWQAYRKERE